MIEVMPGMPAGTVGFRCKGDIEREDYAEVLDDIEPSALWADAKLGFDLTVRHHKDWIRSAIVTDEHWMARATKLFAWMIPGETKVFGVDELAQAKDWLAQP
jgi:hypothetical protein